MQTRFSYFTKNETTIFKGIAILMIVIHNYLHLQNGFFLENEAVFKSSNVIDFIQYIYPVRWYESFSAVAAFLGHYGVQLFIFFSAYGLSMQKIKEKTKENYLQYLLRRLKKLYFLLFFGIAVFLALNFISEGSFYGIKRILKEALLLVTSFGNFKNSTLYNNFSGPFWYFGLMVQLYLLFPAIYGIVKKVNIYLLLGIVYFAITGLYFYDRISDFSVMGTVFGHLPEVILGVYFAQKGFTKPNLFLFLGSIVVFIVSQFYGSLFPLSFLAITIILLYIISTLLQVMNGYYKQTLLYIGEISMILFVVNGPMRLLPFFSIENTELRAERIFLYLIILFVISHILYNIYAFLVKKLKV